MGTSMRFAFGTSVVIATLLACVSSSNAIQPPGHTSVVSQKTGTELAGSSIATMPLPAQRFLLAERFDPRAFAEAINYFVAKGETAAAQELTALSGQSSTACVIRAGLVCRILWQSEDNPIRPPYHCAYLNFEFDTSKLDKWPVYPLANSNGTYFQPDQEWLVGGEMELSEEYIKHCRKRGIFLRTAVLVPNRAQAIGAAKKLIDSNRWKAEFEGGDAKSLSDCVLRQAETANADR